MSKIVLIGTVASSIYGFRKDFILSLQKQGHIVYAFISEYKDIKEIEKIKDLGVEVVMYSLNRSGLNPISDIISTYQLVKKIENIAPDIVFSYFSKPVIFGTLAAKLAKVPRIVGMLEGLGYTFTEQPRGLNKKTQLIKKIQVFLYRIALPQLDQLIFLNPDDPKDLLQQYGIKVKKVEVLGGIGLNLENYKYSENFNSDISFIFVARLLAEKGVHDYIRAAKIVKSKYPGIKFTVLGAIDKSALGSLKEEELQDLIKANIIEYPGYVNNVADWIEQASVFVLPSYYREGVPRSTQEAMAMGRPVITTDVPGCRETVIDGINGFLVPKWNSNALAEKMIYFVEHPEIISVMGAESHKIAVEKFDAEKVNQRLMRILGL
ncbi:glycosyltransferase family 4 protein [Acinetobacter sp. YH12251]|uniref:glycosyltransferase family 4 protein n=1 Tax=Acinetobacter sp. YH12251 TaxID=2601176 RepID=UPI0015D123BB|nr:glycosyltransferase family 4 protein [Acinetobacter sp. YH12251]